jgi:hypothetical protein
VRLNRRSLARLGSFRCWHTEGSSFAPSSLRALFGSLDEVTRQQEVDLLNR